MNQDALAREFRQERAVRRAAFMLEAKRRRIRADLQQLISHLNLLMPAQGQRSNQEQQAMLKSAVERLDDEAFAALLQQVLAERSG